MIIEESKQIKELLPKQDIQHLNDRLCVLIIQKTKYKQLKLKIEILEDYPQSKNSLVIEITSNYLGNRLIKQLHKGIKKVLQGNEAKPRLYLVVKSLYDIIQNNMFVYAYDEVYKIRKLFKDSKTVKIYPCTLYLTHCIQLNQHRLN